MKCDICNTTVAYEKTRCHACSIAFKKGYDEGIEHYAAMFKHLLETHRIVEKPNK